MTGLTRRELLRLGGIAGVSALHGHVLEGMVINMQTLRAVNAVDHLLLGAADLDRGMAWVEKRMGVRPAMGGNHPGVGTRNALLSLGGRQYLEVIAPDPAQTAYNFQIDVRKLAEPRLVNWAAVTTDIDGLAARARAAGLQLFGPRDGSRVRPDGKTLRWRTLGVQANLAGQGVDPVPFFIQWAADSIHPSQDSPNGGELQTLVIHHPNPPGVNALLKQLGIDADVRKADAVRLSATIKTSKAVVEVE
jgi:hypothetical protein